MIKPTDPAFPDEKNNAGIDVLTYIATQIMAANVSNSVMTSKYDSKELSSFAVKSAKDLLQEINKETTPKHLQGSTA